MYETKVQTFAELHRYNIFFCSKHNSTQIPTLRDKLATFFYIQSSLFTSLVFLIVDKIVVRCQANVYLSMDIKMTLNFA